MTLGLRLRPVDTLFFRDARPFGPAGHARSGLPTPQTLAGAIRTWLLERCGVDWDKFAAGVRDHGSVTACLGSMGAEYVAVGDVAIAGPWLMKYGEVLVPVPANLRRPKGGTSGPLRRLDPLRKPPAGWIPREEGMLPLWHRGRERLAAIGSDEFLRPDGLRAYLEGGVPGVDKLVEAKDLYGADSRVGIGVNTATGTAAMGLIYSVDLLALKPGVEFYAEVSGHKSALVPLTEERPMLRWGGEGRSVAVHAAQASHRWPDVASKVGRGRIILLTTPAALGGWKPEGMTLVSAAVRGSQAVSGWDLARGGPKPTRFMVPAGTVLFLPEGSRAPSALGRLEDRKAGWGKFVEGSWSYV